MDGFCAYLPGMLPTARTTSMVLARPSPMDWAAAHISGDMSPECTLYRMFFSPIWLIIQSALTPDRPSSES